MVCSWYKMVYYIYTHIYIIFTYAPNDDWGINGMITIKWWFQGCLCEGQGPDSANVLVCTQDVEFYEFSWQTKSGDIKQTINMKSWHGHHLTLIFPRRRSDGTPFSSKDFSVGFVDLPCLIARGYSATVMGVQWWYPLVKIQKAIEHGHRNSGFSQL